MAMEPINIFSRRIDPRGVLSLLRSLAPSAQVSGPEDAWEEITITVARSGKNPPLLLTFRHDPDYYDGADWTRQMLGMQGYFSRFPEVERKADILRLIGTFRFALATEWTPDLDTDGDERLEYLLAVTQHLDGALFTPSSLRDAGGRILIDAKGTFDPDARMPQMPVVGPTLEAVTPPELDEDEEEEEPQPPTAERVARRALALAAVAARALVEQSDPSEAGVEQYWKDILSWVEAIGIREELEPDEWKVLQRPVGRLDQRAAIDSTWRLEGLGVLAWALKQFDLPPYDELVSPQTLLRSVGFLDEQAAAGLLADPELRSREELDELGKQLLGLHWRLRDYTLRPQAMDFRVFAKDCWFGPMDISPFRLIDGDLALGEHAIHGAPEELFGRTMSAARERHQAINWLHWGDVYSETDTST